MAIMGPSRLGRICVWSLFFLLLSPWTSQGRSIASPGARRRDGHLSVQGILGQLFRGFNLTTLQPQLQPSNAQFEPPEYMLELYQRFANDNAAMPSANIVRSFRNEDSSPYIVGDGGRRRHPLVFNISIPRHERIAAAELRLYTLVQRDRRLFAGLDRNVTIYEVKEHGHQTTGERGGGGEDDSLELVEVVTRRVHAKDNGWEAFDLTDAVHRWHKSQYTTHRLEVHIASLDSAGEIDLSETEEGAGGSRLGGDVDIDRNPEAKHIPLMIIFSDDQSGDRHEIKQELKAMIGHEDTLQNDQEMALSRLEHGKDEDERSPDQESFTPTRSNPRVRRSVRDSPCKRTSLYVDFKDIGWDTWILAPPGYEAYECKGRCSYPLTEHVTPTKHAIVQTLLSMKNPQGVSQACCVPTKLEPISLLYMDNSGIVTYKSKYENMVVTACGCR